MTISKERIAELAKNAWYQQDHSGYDGLAAITEALRTAAGDVALADVQLLDHLALAPGEHEEGDDECD